jgi:hypothetical protein
VLRVELGEEGQPPLPAIDLDDAVVTIGSGPTARIRLPASAARDVHARIEGGAWTCDGASGAIGDGHTFAIGAYRVRVSPSPAGVPVTPPQRTESLARELVRSLLGTDGAPTLTIERGPHAGAKRNLAPPESVLVIGRGDEASWPILDDDLSRTHAEVRRGWDGVTLRDLGSKNGTRLDGKKVATAALRTGQLIELGKLAIRYRDPVEQPAPAPPAGLAPSFWIATLICALALAGLVWVLAT